MRAIRTLANANVGSLAELARKAKKEDRRGRHALGRNPGVPSPQCRAGQHHNCIKKSCTCPCGHGGIQ